MDWSEREVSIPIAERELRGTLSVPERPTGIVVFAHGSGSSRRSPRNRAVAGHLVQGSLATLLLDLLTEDEERVDQRTRHLRFDIRLLSRRVVCALDWVLLDPAAALPVGLFGSSTGAAAALVAAAERPDLVRAVVSRGGRPDLAGPALERVRAPTLLIVGERDPEVLELNRIALGCMARAPRELETIPQATHLFEEPGALEAVADHARRWFQRHLDLGPGRADAGRHAP